MKKNRKNKKGFSLIEVIVVIAIMAVLTGLMAPRLIQYIEKAKIEHDRQELSVIFVSIVYALADPEVAADPYTKSFKDQMTAGKVDIATIDPTSKLGEELMQTLNWTSLNYTTDYIKHIKMGCASSRIYIQNYGSIGKPVTMWISFTDKNHSQDPTGWDDLGDCISIKDK